jgi:hypothetical protein
MCSHMITSWALKEQSFVVEGYCECNMLICALHLEWSLADQKAMNKSNIE